MKHVNLVLPNELMKVELPLWKIWKVHVSRVSFSSERIFVGSESASS